MAGSDDGTLWLTTEQVSKLLGVKSETVYAYASRGRLHRKVASDSRTSLYDPREVAALAGRGRKLWPHSESEPALTMITLIRENTFYYRGIEALHMAGRSSFEQVAEWLWSDSDTEQPAVEWEPDKALVEAINRAVAAFSADRQPTLLEYLRVAVQAAAVLDGPRRPGVAEWTGLTRRLLASILEAMPVVSGGGDDSFVGRLWRRLARADADAAELALLNSALVLHADHELACSTVAARTVATVGAGCYEVIQAGLCAVGTPAHGGDALLVENLLKGARSERDVGTRMDILQNSGRRWPGFARKLYANGDPRSVFILRELAERGGTRADIVAAVLDRARQEKIGYPSKDFALAALTYYFDMPAGAADLMFCLARTAGWIAHALEVRRTGPPRRLRAVYVGARDVNDSGVAE